MVSGKTNLISIFINIPHYGPALLNCTWSGQTIIDVPTTLYITYYTMLITNPGRVLWRSWENIKTCIQVDSFVDGSRKSSSKYEYCDLHWVETTGQDMVRKIWIEKYSELLYCCPFVNGFVCGLCMYSDSVFSTHNARLEVQAHSFSAVKGISALSHFGTVILCYILGFLHSDPGEMAKRKKQTAKRLLHFITSDLYTFTVWQDNIREEKHLWLHAMNLCLQENKK